MANQLNSGNLNTLKLDETLLVRVQKTANDSYQALFVENIDRSVINKTESDNTETIANALAELNYSNDKFRRGGKNHVYITATAKDLERVLQIPELDIENSDFGPITTKSGKTKYALDLNILNPMNMDTESKFYQQRFRVRLVEDTTPDAWQANNDDFKVNPSTGEALMKDGKHIYTHHTITFSKGDGFKDYHQLVQHDKVATFVDAEDVMQEAGMSMM